MAVCCIVADAVLSQERGLNFATFVICTYMQFTPGALLASRRRAYALSTRFHHKFSAVCCPSRYSDFGGYSSEVSPLDTCLTWIRSDDLVQAS